MSASDPAAQFAARTRQILLDSHAILANDHFVYDSGEHGSGWIDKDVINEQTAGRRCAGCSPRRCGTCSAAVICGPATGGLVVAQWTAHALEALAVFAEHDDTRTTAGPEGPVRGPFILRRGYDQVVRGQRVVVVDDVVNTGLSLRQTVAAVTGRGGRLWRSARW